MAAKISPKVSGGSNPEVVEGGGSTTETERDAKLGETTESAAETKPNPSLVESGESKAKAGLYVVQDSLVHDDVSFAIGDEVELTKREAAPLLAVRVVKLKTVSEEGENG